MHLLNKEKIKEQLENNIFTNFPVRMSVSQIHVRKYNPYILNTFLYLFSLQNQIFISIELYKNIRTILEQAQKYFIHIHLSF